MRPFSRAREWETSSNLFAHDLIRKPVRDHALPPPLKLCRLVLIVPPGLRNAAGKSRLFWRKPEHIPIGDAVRRKVPMRYPVAASADHAVERATGDGQFAARVGPDDLLDQRIDYRISDAGAVVRARHIG